MSMISPRTENSPMSCTTALSSKPMCITADLKSSRSSFWPFSRVRISRCRDSGLVSRVRKVGRDATTTARRRLYRASNTSRRCSSTWPKGLRHS